MRTDVSAPAGLVAQRSATVTLYPLTATPAQLIAGTASGGVDLSPYVDRLSHTSTQAKVQLRWHTQFVGSAALRPGQLVSIKVNGQVSFNGVVASSSTTQARGERVTSLVVRRRDAFPLWRVFRRVTENYGRGTNIGAMARDVCKAVGLSPSEYFLPDVGVPIPHANVQLADVNAWEMLTRLLQAARLEPYVDARGVVKGISRDVTRAPALKLTDAQIYSLVGQREAAPVTAVSVKWLDPTLALSEKPEGRISQGSRTVGFFDWLDKRRETFSQDGTQRVRDPYLVLLKNDGTSWATVRPGETVGVRSNLIPGVLPDSGSIEISDVSPTTIEVALHAYGPQLIAEGSLGVATLIAANFIPEPVVTAGIGATSGTTVPAVKAATRAAGETVLLYALLNTIVCNYEVWGVAWDYVPQTNESLAYDQDAPAWLSNVEELENDFIANEGVARGLAISELRYRAKAVSATTLIVADDLRIEVGDIIDAAGTKLYVTDYERDLSRGSEPRLSLSGFIV